MEDRSPSAYNMAHYKGIPGFILSSHLLHLFLWTTILPSLVSRCTVHCVVLTTPELDNNATSSGEGDGLIDIKEIRELNRKQKSEDGYNHENFSVRGFIIDDDSIIVQPVIKPESTKESLKATKKKGERKKGEKKKNKGQKKKKNLCLTTHKKFCVHGECKWLANLQIVTCKCKPDFIGERCTEQSMKTGKKQPDDMTTTVLAVAAVLLSLISIIAIIIIIVVHTRRKYASYQCEAEEKKRLGQENASDEVDV